MLKYRTTSTWGDFGKTEFCLDGCPYGFGCAVGSVKCQKCSNFVDMDGGLEVVSCRIDTLLKKVENVRSECE